MKKSIFYIFLISISLTIFSCAKEDATKDVDISITKLNQFNEKFSEFYSDGVISKDTAENQKSSEYDQIKKLATSYYEIMNKINSGLTSKDSVVYKEAYLKALEDRKDEIDAATKLFMENLEKMTGKSEHKCNQVVKIEEVKKVQIVSMKTVATMDKIDDEMGRLYGALMGFISQNKLKMSGAPVAIYYSWSDTTSEFECGIPVEGTVKGTNEIFVKETYEGKVVTSIHYGAYDKVGCTWTAIDEYIADNKLEINGAPWEEYITDPTMEPDTSKWQTKIYQPIK